MLRINLLPAYIAQKRRVRNAIIGMIALFSLVTGLGLAYQFMVLQPEVAKLEQDANDMQARADAVTAYKAETSRIRTKVAPLQEKVQFVELIRYHNTIRQKIYRNVARYTYKQVEYNSMAVTGNTLAVSGYVRQISDIGRFYITLFGNPDITAVSLTSPIPGWPVGVGGQQQPQQVNPNGNGPLKPAYPVAATATLVRAVAPPQVPPSAMAPVGGAGGGAAAAGVPGIPGDGAPIGPAADTIPPPDAPAEP